MDCGAGKRVHGEEPDGEKHGRVFGTTFDTRRARVCYIFGTEYQNVSKTCLILSTIPVSYTHLTLPTIYSV